MRLIREISQVRIKYPNFSPSTVSTNAPYFSGEVFIIGNFEIIQHGFKQVKPEMKFPDV